MVDDHVFECAEREPKILQEGVGPEFVRRRSRPDRVPTIYYDNHRSGLACGDQVIEYELRLALPRPACLILSGAVLQNEYRVAAFRVFLVLGRRVDERAAPLAGGLRQIPLFAHLTVRNVRDGVELDTGLRHFYSTGFPAIAEVRPARRIVDGDAVENEPIIVKSGNHSRDGYTPDPVGSFGHGERPFPQSVTTCRLDAVGFRGLECEGNAAVRVNSGALRTGHIRSRW